MKPVLHAHAVSEQESYLPAAHAGLPEAVALSHVYGPPHVAGSAKPAKPPVQTHCVSEQLVVAAGLQPGPGGESEAEFPQLTQLRSRQQGWSPQAGDYPPPQICTHPRICTPRSISQICTPDPYPKSSPPDPYLEPAIGRLHL